MNNRKQKALELLAHLDKPLVLSYAKNMSKVANPLDYGWINEHGNKTRISKYGNKTRISKYQLECHRSGKKFVRKLTQTNILEHLAGLDTYYYVSNYQSGAMLGCFDLDWKDSHKAEHGEESDTFSCAKYIASTLGLAPENYYLEKSTGGYGCHMYVLFDIHGYSVADIRDTLRSAKNSLSSLLNREGFRCTFDGVLGNPSKADGYSGSMVKIPRPSSNEGLTRFLALKAVPFSVLLPPPLTYTVTDCHTPASEIGQCQILQEHIHSTRETVYTTVTDCGTPAYQDLEESNSQSPSQSPQSPLTYTVTDCHTPATSTPLRNATPNERMIWCCQQLARKLKRLPTPQELVHEYERRNLHTGQDKHRCRPRRAKDAIAYVAKTFSPLKLGPEFSKSAALAFINSLGLLDEDLIFAENKKLRLDTFAEYLVYVTSLITATNPDPKKQGTVSYANVIKKLGINPAQYYLCKSLAAEHSLIVTVSNSYIVGGKARGISKRYALGTNHPLSKNIQN